MKLFTYCCFIGINILEDVTTHNDKMRRIPCFQSFNEGCLGGGAKMISARQITIEIVPVAKARI